ncbi:MAG TPA: cache domain-containing protein [Anaerolineales bacterium]|nr:cache domain-containing protein [Anaerolineales bacterium]
MRLSLRSKIILPYLLLALGLALGAAYIISQVIFDSIEERFLNQLIDVGKLANEWMVREEDRMLGTLRFVANTDGLPQAVEAGDAETLRQLIYPVLLNAGEEEAQVLDAQGRALLSLYHREGESAEIYDYSQGSMEFSSLPFVQAVLAGQVDTTGDKFAGVATTLSGTQFYISGPIYNADRDVVGVVLIGKPTTQIVRGIREELLAQVTLYDLSGQILDTTFLDPPQLAPEDLAALQASETPSSLLRRLQSADVAYREITAPWLARNGEPLGLMGISFAENFLVRLSETTWFKILFFVLTTLILVILLGYFIAEQISRPILDLNQAAGKVSKGDLTVQVSPKSNDEIASMTQEFNHMVASLQQSKLDLVTAYDKTLEGWAKALELRDGETMGHSLRVTEMTVELSRRMGIAEDQLVHIQRGALIHDIGKMAIPDHILLKPGSLTYEEWKVMQKHPTYAVEMLGEIPFLWPALSIPASHHEKWDGTGYPRGLKTHQIPLPARIFAVVDVWDALCSDRPYRSALSAEDALYTIQSKSGSHFDPKVVEAFLAMIRETYSFNSASLYEPQV